MKSVTNFKCAGCGGQMQYDISKQGFYCSSCGVAGETKNHIQNIREYDFLGYTTRERSYSNEDKVLTVQCNDCGNEMIMDQQIIATTCPMCGSAQIKTSAGMTGIPPEGIIPFRIDRYEGERMFATWVKKRWFAPNRFREAYGEGKLEGVYLPYWTYDAIAIGHFHGQGGRTRTRRTSDGKTQTYTQWFPVSGTVQADFDDLLVSGMEGDFAHLAQSVAPFNTVENSKPFALEYLAGYKAKKYTINGVAAFEEAKKTMISRLHSEATSAIYARGYSSANVFGVDAKYYDVTYKLMLLPVWKAEYHYNGKKYGYTINGESGKVSGERPYSWVKILAAVLMAILLVFGIVAAAQGKEEPNGQNPFENSGIVQEDSVMKEEMLWHGLDKVEIR